MQRLVYLSPVAWSSFEQRPHKFVEWFHATHGGKVLWVDPYPTRLPELADLQRARMLDECATGKSRIPPAWLTILYPYSLPIEPLPGAGAINRLLWNKVLRAIHSFNTGNGLLCIGKPSELALQVLARYPALASLYDAMDDFPAFYRGLSRAAMERRVQAIASRVTRISVSSTALAQRFAAYHTKLALVLNACAVENLPPFEAAIKRPQQPVLGYVGTIGHWFDWRWVRKLAEANGAMHIRLVGPAYVGPHGPLPHNIELLPACDHVTAMKHIQEFSVGLIPFRQTDITASVDPIKYYEYRALGVPVLSTRFGEMALRDAQPGVFLADRHADLGKLVTVAMSCRCEMDEIRAFRNANSWEARFDSCGILP